MKSKTVVMLSTLILALGLMAQTATQTTPAPTGDKAKSCACCNHDMSGAAADKKASCCGKGGDCCKDGKCDMKSADGKQAMSHDEMMSKDGKAGAKCAMMSGDKMACCGKDDGCCKEGMCDMAKACGTNCCNGNKCARPQTGL